MENRYPLFAGGRILKKESLWDLRDYAYGGWQLQYADYTDGVIKGCRVRVEGSNLIVGKGMMKYGDFIFLMDEEAKIPFEAENRTTVLKAGFEIKREHSDYLAYEVRFFLDHELERKENQIELCRFHLREGSVLRDSYKDFADMGTEYDTVNLLYATVAGRGKGRLHPQVLLQFAAELQEIKDKSMPDIVFCYEIWNSMGGVNRDMIKAYLSDKNGMPMQEIDIWDNAKIAIELERYLSKGNRSASRHLDSRVIFVD